MKNIYRLATLLLIYAIGCTHVTMIDHDSPDATYYVNKKAKSRTSQIQLKNNERCLGKDISVRPDSTSWFDAVSGIRRTVPSAEISQIQIVDRGRGALDGFLIGASIGCVPGGALWVSFVNAFCDSDCNTTGAAIVGGLVGGAAAGLVVGLPIGSAIGSKHKFVFDDRSAASRKNKSE